MKFLSHAWLAALASTACVYAQSSTSSASSSASTSCSPLELVVARGTNENGNLGGGVGDPLLNATSALIPGVTGYRVDYPALLTLESVNLGIADVVAHVKSQLAKCPEQKLVLVGYSQGGFVTLGAALQIDPSDFARIVAVVQFGDPGNRNATDPNKGFPPALGKKLKENCNAGDPVCTNNGTDFTKHTEYNVPALRFISSSAEYIKEQYDTDGQAGPSPAFPGPGSRVEGNRLFWCGLNNLIGLPGSQDCEEPASSSSAASSPSSSGSVSSTASTNSTVPAITGTAPSAGPSGSGGSGGNSTGLAGTGTGTVSRSSSAPAPTSDLPPSAARRTAAVPSIFYALACLLFW